jgi:hypothetical protein
VKSTVKQFSSIAERNRKELIDIFDHSKFVFCSILSHRIYLLSLTPPFICSSFCSFPSLHCLGMNEVKNSLDVKQRHFTKSNSLETKRLHYERSLYPSSATLIIVPLALLEHWYEQILRHLHLGYFAKDHHHHRHHNHHSSSLKGDQSSSSSSSSPSSTDPFSSTYRGIVYLDGLGDIVDIEAPLSKLVINASTARNRNIEASSKFLAHYSIVVTTIERCILEQKILNLTHASCSASSSSSSSSSSVASSAISASSRYNSLSSTESSNLQQIRWLRLVIDEGHEIGKTTKTEGISLAKETLLATQYISSLAAERRWIMSGTPTTGAYSEIGLLQLFHLLCFLRHPSYVSSDGSGGSIAASDDGRLMEYYEKQWMNDIVKPCIEQKKESWEKVKIILKDIMVRHTKVSVVSSSFSCLPVSSSVAVASLPLPFPCLLSLFVG